MKFHILLFCVFVFGVAAGLVVPAKLGNIDSWQNSETTIKNKSEIEKENMPWKKIETPNRVGRNFQLPLNNPMIVEASQADHMKPDDIVFGIELDGHQRAYPWWIIQEWHVVNDRFLFDPSFANLKDSKHVMLVLCDRCTGGSAYLAVVKGKPNKHFTFSVCPGNRANMFKEWGTFGMCDVETGSKWHPFKGESVEGPLTGVKLVRIPLRVVRWRDWKSNFPNSTVLYGTPEVRLRVHGSEEGHNSPYNKEIFGENSDTRLEGHELVFGLTLERHKRGRAYSFELFDSNDNVVYDKLGNQELVILKWGEFSILAFDAEVKNQKLTNIKIISQQPWRFQDDSGTIWDSTGTALSGPLQGNTLIPVDGYMTKWFEYARIYPETELVN